MHMSSDDTKAAANCRPGFPQQEKLGGGTRRKQAVEDGGKMIIAVSGFPEVYDVSSFIYRDVQKTTDAWKKVSEIETHKGYVAVIRAM